MGPKGPRKEAAMRLCEKCHGMTGCEGHLTPLPPQECALCGLNGPVVDCRDAMALEIERLSVAVRRFARLMLSRLLANIEKGGWQDCRREWLLRRTLEECGEVVEAMGSHEGLRGVRIAQECADAANFLLMIALNEMDEKAREAEIVRVAGAAMERAKVRKE